MAAQKPSKPEKKAKEPAAQAPAPAPPGDAEEAGAERPGPLPHRRDRLRGIARRIFRELEDDEGHEGADGSTEGREPQPRGDARELLASMLETGDKAKTEIVRLVAREVRSYLDALELHKDLNHLLTNYSLEVKASVHLKPLAEALEPDGAPPRPSVSASLAPYPEGEPDPEP